MRLYISKEEGLLLQQLLSEELVTASKLHNFLWTDRAAIYRKNKACDLYYKIESCLQKQKTGYNRKEK